jgi:hypothetical protein
MCWLVVKRNIVVIHGSTPARQFVRMCHEEIWCAVVSQYTIGCMKQPMIRARSTEGRDALLGFVIVVGVNILIIVDPWHFIKTRWPALQVLETIVAVVVAIFVLCFFGAILQAAYVGFWPTMYSLVEWHRKRAEKRDATMVPRKAYVLATFSSNLRSDLFMAARLLLWGVLGLGILWGIRACSKAIIKPDRHPPPITILTPEWWPATAPRLPRLVSCALPACLIDLCDVKPAMPLSLHGACLTALAEPNQAAAAAHGFEHLLHLGVLAEEVVDLLDGGARASGDALAAAAVDEFVVAALAGGKLGSHSPHRCVNAKAF